MKRKMFEKILIDQGILSNCIRDELWRKTGYGRIKAKELSKRIRLLKKRALAGCS